MYNFEAIDDFDSHISMSIPNYGGLSDIFTAVAQHETHPEGVIVDLGCSTGRFINGLSLDPSVTRQAVDSIDIYEYPKETLTLSDCEDHLQGLDSADVVVVMFTLQFLGKHKRARVVEHLRRLVDGGATLLIAEKCIFASRVESIVKSEHLTQKIRHFDPVEILKKEKELAVSMRCLTDEALLEEMNSLGGTCTQVWQSYNFKGYVIAR